MRFSTIAAAVCVSAVVPVLSHGAENNEDLGSLSIKVLTWNVQYGARAGESRNRWPDRAPLLLKALKTTSPDVLCIQEALIGQVREIAAALPGHGVVAAGRDDGKTGGEHCAVFYDQKAFALAASGTFWLSDTPEIPSRTWGNHFPRICTWVELRHAGTNTAFRVFNTHFPLMPQHRWKAAALVARRLASMPALPTVVVGDFNEANGLPRLPALVEAGLADAFYAARAKTGNATYRLGPLPVARLDWILTTKDWSVETLSVVRASSDGVHASDHDGLAGVLSIGRGHGDVARHAGPVLRVLSYNVRKGSRVAEIAGVIEAHGADVALLQEIDQGTRRAAGVDQPAQLRAALGMHVYYAPSYEVDGGTTGQAIVSRLPLVETERIQLANSRAIGARGAVRWRGRRVVLISAHFSSTYKFDLDHAKESAEARLREAERIAGIARDTAGAIIVGGDLNCVADSDPIRVLSEELERVSQDRATFPAVLPVLVLDHVFCASALQVRSASTGSKGTSDHLPVIVEFELSGASPGGTTP